MWGGDMKWYEREIKEIEKMTGSNFINGLSENEVEKGSINLG